MQGCKGTAAPSKIRVPYVCKSLHKQHSYPIHSSPAQTGAREKHRGSVYSPCHSLPESFVTRSSKYFSSAEDPGGCWVWWQSLLSAQGLATLQDQRIFPKKKQRSIPAAVKIPATMEAASQAVPTEGIILQQICSCSLGAVFYCA